MSVGRILAKRFSGMDAIGGLTQFGFAGSATSL
jgi:hypothetical protein